MSARVDGARDRLQQVLDELRAISRTAGGDELCAVLGALETGQRSLDQVSVAALAAVERGGVFTGRGYRSPAGALADLLRWDPRRARRYVGAADQVIEKVGLAGEPLPARLEATATVFASGETSMRHVEVIASVLTTSAAERLAPSVWADAEQQLAAHAADYTPAELHTWGTQLVALLDQDGPEPDDPDRPEPQINELHLVRHRGRPGGSLRGRFEDPEMFERIRTVLDTHARPRDPDDPRTPAQRQAEGLAEVCGYALAHAPTQVLPETGGRRPQLIVTVALEDLERRARTGMLEFAGQTTPAALRLLACDASVIPVVLGGRGEPLDVGRAMRTIPESLRRAVTARDRGCAHPGCDLPPAWCQIHHIIPWEHHGPTAIDNLVMLCPTHHRLAHHSEWQIRIQHGRPEFIPPGWIDPRRRPRRQPDLTGVAGQPTAPEPPERVGATMSAGAGTPIGDDRRGPDTDTDACRAAASEQTVTVADFDWMPEPETWPIAVGFRDDGADDVDGSTVKFGPSAVRVADLSGLDAAGALDRWRDGRRQTLTGRAGGEP